MTIRTYINDVFIDHATGRYSHGKVWTSIANITGTFIVIYLTVHSVLPTEMFVAYIGIIGGYTTFGQFLSYKYSTGLPVDDSAPATDLRGTHR